MSGCVKNRWPHWVASCVQQSGGTAVVGSPIEAFALLFVIPQGIHHCI
jgi:hypothetical protein